MSKETHNALAEAIANHLESELQAPHLLSNWVLLSSVDTVDEKSQTLYTYFTPDHMGDHHMFGLMEVGRRMIARNFDKGYGDGVFKDDADG